MSIQQFLNQSVKKLELAGVGTARLDILVLLEDELKADRAWLLAHLEYHFQDQVLEKLKKKIARRVRHEPLSYIRGRTEFYGRSFHINKYVLEPRPESEAMIEELKYLRGIPLRPRIADIGTGSGALAITAKLEMPAAQVLATDIDDNCLKLAAKNARRHNADVALAHGDLMRAVRGPVSVILANLPYVPTRYHINQAATHEPDIAIYGGGDGLELYRRFFTQLTELYEKPKYVLCEALPTQHINLGFIAQTAGYAHRRTNDFIQVFESIY